MWAEFGLSILANIIGIVIGAPVAWWLFLRQKKHEERLTADTVEELVGRALEAVERAVCLDQWILSLVLKAAETGDTILDATFDATAWDAVKSDLVHLPDPRLKQRIANYFGGIEQLVWLQRQRFEHASGVGSVLTGFPQTKETLLVAIQSKALHLKTAGTQIQNAVNAMKSVPGHYVN